MFSVVKLDMKFKLIMLSLLLLVVISFFAPLKFISKLPFFASSSLFASIEDKTFDLRQKYLSNFHKTADDVVIVTVDNMSYEYLTKYFGHWPMPRSVYVDVINYIRAQNPNSLAIDIQFVGEWKNRPLDDKNLADLFEKFDNLYTIIFFDDASFEKRIPVNLPEKHSSIIHSRSDNFKPYYAKNFRSSYPLMLEKGNLTNANLLSQLGFKNCFQIF